MYFERKIESGPNLFVSRSSRGFAAR